jgi:uncharacterized SAM-binding protein YcdF (DUF218 family)
METIILKKAQILWDYLRLGKPLHKAECLLVMGSHDLRVADYAARVYLEGWAPIMVFSGGLGNFTREIWHETEAEKFSRLAIEKGVPEYQVLIENQSTNTGENVQFSHELLQHQGLNPASFLLVHKPYMERRALATFQQFLPEKIAYVTSPPVPFMEYPTREIPMETVIQIMVGDFQRIMIYPQKGYQVPQRIPKKVVTAYEFLVKKGFNQHLIK